ncbi:MAG: hypothetical protein ACJAS1_000557 [Oleiphilaceae bacterium]|jgi:hypothetical protein
MADMYSDASFMLFLSSDQTRFASDVLLVMTDNDCDFNSVDDLKIAEQKGNHAYLLAREIVLAFDDDYESHNVILGFKHEDRDEGIWIYSEGNFISTNAADFVHHILEHFDIDESVLIEVAHTCSKPDLGQFGGETAFVTKLGVNYLHPTVWAREQDAIFQRQLVGVIY